MELVRVPWEDEDWEEEDQNQIPIGPGLLWFDFDPEEDEFVLPLDWSLETIEVDKDMWEVLLEVLQPLFRPLIPPLFREFVENLLVFLELD